jgi:hypothetical protein
LKSYYREANVRSSILEMFGIAHFSVGNVNSNSPDTVDTPALLHARIRGALLS